jgi:hypothetical protein
LYNLAKTQLLEKFPLSIAKQRMVNNLKSASEMAYIPLRSPSSVKRGLKVIGGRLRSGVDEMQSIALQQVSFWSRGTGQCVSRL